MSYHVHRAADPPELVGPPAVRFVAPGSSTAGRYGLFEYTAPPGSGAPTHLHHTFSESFYVLGGELTIFDGGTWSVLGPGDYVYVPEEGAHAFRNDGDVDARFLILFAPGIPRERFFTELHEIRDSGRTLSQGEWVDFYVRHDQVNL
ncbi:cupin domain-containing protein [Pseudonocardia sp.]|uniref:cupin domain-containing protein n=1 Tax=Pseudonocardia sp. TaxID=60912 RepID=UPI002628B279|nr:cupin domain-containing protein [Pseudonocardia sp.]